MSAKIVSCVTIACDVCGEPLRDDEDGIVPHFETTRDAAKWAAEWLIGADGYAICDMPGPEHEAALAALMPMEPTPVIDGQCVLVGDDGEPFPVAP